jgi:hypothetical protein
MISNETVMATTLALLKMKTDDMKKLKIDGLKEIVKKKMNDEAVIFKDRYLDFPYIFHTVALDGVVKSIIRNLHSLISNAIYPVIQNYVKGRLTLLKKGTSDNYNGSKKGDQSPSLNQLDLKDVSNHVYNLMVNIIMTFGLGRKWTEKEGQKDRKFPSIAQFIENYREGNKRAFTVKDDQQLNILSSATSKEIKEFFFPPEANEILKDNVVVGSGRSKGAKKVNASGYRTTFKMKRDQILGLAISMVKNEAASMKRHFFPGPTTSSSMITVNRALFAHILLSFLDSPGQRKVREKLTTALDKESSVRRFSLFKWEQGIRHFYNFREQGEKLTRICFPKYNEIVYGTTSGKAKDRLYFSGCMFSDGFQAKFAFFDSKKPNSYGPKSKAVTEHGCKANGYPHGNLLRVRQSQ